MKMKLAVISVTLLGMAAGATAQEGTGPQTEAWEALPVPATKEGVSAREMEVLKKHYKWKKSDQLPKGYTLKELYTIMDDSADNTLEMEDYDWQLRKLVVALMVVGDKAFAKELDGRAVPIQKEALQMLTPLWEKYKLHYPKTEELAAAIKRLPETQ